MKNSSEDALRKAAAAFALRQIREVKERADYMLVHGLTEADVYGKHAREGWEQRENLGRWIITPKGLKRVVPDPDDVVGCVPVLVRDPDYIGEHRERNETLRRYYDPRFGKDWSGYVGKVPYQQRYREHKEPQHLRHKPYGYPNPAWELNYFRVNTFGWTHYVCRTKHDESCWCTKSPEEVMD
ncbi:hypothetical protein GUMBALL_78 [Mycobacterium phage Gumball]|uniref:Uncharacterized protein n=2 Tax=Plotvirus plot TaxID=2170099 RepID=B5U3V6_9CAUD|nr:gp80 [Mycobacterium phage Gumball]ACI06452.1 hypothetical protein GUMBALL_78 [Mycobacterium phage Gumball]AEK10289.1 hypothetical protein PBI_SIRHARLEY_80 [Mycobacterium phage SirHarley]